jgi:hypothetical protein
VIKKQFRAVINKPMPGYHLITILFEADNIIEAGNDLVKQFEAIGSYSGILPDMVVSLTEIPEEN